MDVWSHDRNHADHQEIKRIGELEGVKQGYRWQFGKLWEISVFPLDKTYHGRPLFISLGYVMRGTGNDDSCNSCHFVKIADR